MSAELAAILVAAGQSLRMGTDKLWIDFFGRPTWRWSLDSLLAEPGVGRLALVTPADGVARFSASLPPAADRCLLVAGGAERSDSVLAGLAALSSAGCPDDTIVLVHDAARPAASPELIRRVVAAAGPAGGVVPVLAVHDTLLRVGAGQAIDRSDLVAAQTPQLGRLGELRGALEAGGSFTDEASALMAAGIEVRSVEGEPANRKLTDPGDEAMVRAALRARALGELQAPSAEVPAGARAGIGFDAHRLEAGRPLRLGGLAFNQEPRGLAGHSDGDVALHAAIDALLGAAGVGDIGTLFPSDDVTWRGADSGELLSRAVGVIRRAGWRPASLDLTIVAAAPAIASRRAEVTARIAALLDVPPAAVSVKGTTSDGLGFGGGEGIAAYAVAVVEAG